MLNSEAWHNFTITQIEAFEKDQNELIRKVYMAQKEDPNPGDFCQLVEHDCQMINCQLGDDQIQAMTKYDIKVLIKKMAKQAAFQN